MRPVLAELASLSATAAAVAQDSHGGRRSLVSGHCDLAARAAERRGSVMKGRGICIAAAVLLAGCLGRHRDATAAMALRRAGAVALAS